MPLEEKKTSIETTPDTKKSSDSGGKEETPEDAARKLSALFDKGYGEGSRRARTHFLAELSDTLGAEVTEENYKELFTTLKGTKKVSPGSDDKRKESESGGEKTDAKIAELERRIEAKDKRIEQLDKNIKEMSTRFDEERREQKISSALSTAIKGNNLREEVDPEHVAHLFRKEFHMVIDPASGTTKVYRVVNGKDQYQVDQNGDPVPLQTVTKNWLSSEASYFLRPPEGGANLSGTGKPSHVGGKLDIANMTMEDVNNLPIAEIDKLLDDEKGPRK